MPIYEYECLECGLQFDLRQSVGDPPPAGCPVGHRQVRRRLSRPAIIFKGSGFYVTDHGRNGRSATPAGSSGRATGKGETSPKPEKKDSSAPSDS